MLKEEWKEPQPWVHSVASGVNQIGNKPYQAQLRTLLSQM